MKEISMTAIGKVTAAAAVLTGCFLFYPASGRAGSDNDNGNSNEAKVRVGYQIAPVLLNLNGKQPELVGLGSYLVNTLGNCNDCHTNSPANEYASGGNPFMGQFPKKVNSAAYLRGGQTFGPGGAFTSRNLTPDKDGKPAGLTADEFTQVIRSGEDLDHWHPAFGPLLQVMPWPKYQDMSDTDLRAIYEYLRAIPCIEGDPGNPLGSDTHGQRCQ